MTGLAETQVPRAYTVTAKLDGALAVLAGLEAELAELALAAVDREPGAAERLTVHRAKMAAAKTAVEELRAARALAVDLDQRAAVSRADAIRSADPEAILYGITPTACCSGCSANECLLAGGLARCGHPWKGAIAPEQMNDPSIRRLRTLALEQIEAYRRGEIDYSDDDGEEADDDQEEAA